MSVHSSSRTTWRLIWVMTLMSLLCIGIALATLRAAAQAQTEAPPPASGRAIEDDPTVAPDPQESADNNVSFPVDI